MADNDNDRRDLLAATMWNIRVDSATAEVAAAMGAAGVETLILKGPALSDWYAENSPRTYVDADLLVAPRSEARASQILVDLGFTRTIADGGLPTWWQEHASSWHRDHDGVSIDLHRRLQGANAEPAYAWTRLWTDREPMDIAGRTLERLSDGGRALYVTLHAAHDGQHGLKAREHLEAALTRAPVPVWERAAALAIELDAVDAFSAGLQLAPGGSRMAEALGIPANRSVEAAIRAATAPPVALGFEQLSSARGVRKVHILWVKLAPPPGFIRHWWPPATRNRGMLALGYLYRPIWLLARAPAGFRAWRAARRQVRSSQRGEDNSSR